MSRLSLLLFLAALPVAAAEETFLVRFGGEAPADWSGSVRIEGGRLAGLAGWQFDAGDSIGPDGASWRTRTVEQEHWHAPWERSLFPTKTREKLSQRGVLATVEMDGPGRVVLTTPRGEASFRPSETTWGRPFVFAGGDATVARAPRPRRMETPAGDEDYPALLTTRAGDGWLAWTASGASGDRLWARRGDGAAEPLTPAGRDLFRVELAEGSDGAVWAVWSEMRRGDWDIYGRVWLGGAWGPEGHLAGGAGPEIFHSLATDEAGRLFLVWQSFRDGQSDIYLRVRDGVTWGTEQRVSPSPANDWEPHVAARGGRAAIVWDSYDSGNYDVLLREWSDGRLGPVERVASTPAFEARPRAAYDDAGRLWLTWEEGDAEWGKDYVAGVADAGMGLLMRRQPRVAVREGGRLRELPGSIPETLPEEFAQAMTGPRLAFDGGGNPWLFFRFRTNTPTGGKPRYRTIWRLGATSFQNGAWTPAVEFADGFGRIDAPTAVARQADGVLRVVWPSDGRRFPNGFPGEHELYEARLEPGPPAAEFAWRDFRPAADALPVYQPAEAADVARVRGYRAEVDGKRLRIVRGDMHRHTDISWDGNRDGSLFDCYRYALDAAAIDYVGVADHGAGEMIPYNYRMIQRAVDLFTIPGKFAPLYGYERSRGYPSGHRNVFFDRPGVPVFDFTAEERADNQTGVDALFVHLRREKGIVMSHTSATGAGTDWRDEAPDVEPLVEIYQGYRKNYEHEGAPRAPSQNERPAGYVWKAWEKGLKLGLQSSSDHVSTHASYAMLWLEELDKASILGAIRARAAYAATDNILVDFRVNGALMGSEISSSSAPRIEAKIIGTAAVAKVEVIRNNAYVHTHRPNSTDVSFVYVDNEAPAGENWYYIRVEQEDGEIAWASPVWVTMR